MAKWLDEKILIKYCEDRCNTYILPDGRKILGSERNPSFGAYPDISKNELDTGEVIPCEIEWSTTNFKAHGHDIEMLIEKSGFLVVFIENSVFDVPQVKINEDDFINWFCKKSKRIAGETVSTIKKSTKKRTDPFVWIIYIPSRGAKNYEIALKKGIWGYAEPSKRKRRGIDLIEDIRKDDCVVFVKMFQFDKQNKIKTPRVKDVSKFSGFINEIVVTRITKGYYYDEKLQIWSDNIYPHRFKFDTSFFLRGTHIPFNPKSFGYYLHKQIVHQINAHTIQQINSTMLLRIMNLCKH